MSADGLSNAEAGLRLARHGPNALPEPASTSFAQRLLKQFRSPFIYILLFALALELAIWLRSGGQHSPVEVLAIAVLLALNAFIGAAQEQRSDAALARLRAMAHPLAWVKRDGRLAQIASRDIVPGDLLRLDAGDRVHADATLLAPATLLVDESLLTGESLPVERGAGDEVLAGTLVLRGRAEAIVARTGAKSAIGRVAALLGLVDVTKTPLERKLDKLARQTATLVVVLALAVMLAGLAVEGLSRFEDVFIFAVALAVAVVPEELPAVLALTLALGVERMAKRRALVRRLSAVEALGSVTVIVTDKTGTLTENRLHVVAIDTDEPARALRACVLANDATEGEGDALDRALLEHARARGLDAASERAASPRLSARAFDSAWKYASATVRETNGTATYVKGAPETVLAMATLDDKDRERWAAQLAERSREGHRVIGLAWTPGASEKDLRFLGLASLWDPPRAEVAQSIRIAREAGVRVVMATGDHPGTSAYVARDIGLPQGAIVTGQDVERADEAELAKVVREASIFARVRPEHKLRIVEALQRAGEIVAVTGDGINDAPALKRADVGVAMGLRGSDVAREAADIVLLDDDFATVVRAIEEGRGLYENIQKFLRFMFSIHLAFFLLLVGGAIGAYAIALRDPSGALILPLTALQILWINFLADGPPSFALGLDPNGEVMRRPPRAPDAALIDRASMIFVGSSALGKVAGAVALLIGLPMLGFSLVATQSAIFAYEFAQQLLFAYPVRRVRERGRTNLWLHAATILGFALIAASFGVPSLRALLGLTGLSPLGIGLVTATTLASWGAAEAVAWALRRRGAGPARRQSYH